MNTKRNYTFSTLTGDNNGGPPAAKVWSKTDHLDLENYVPKPVERDQIEYEALDNINNDAEIDPFIRPVQGRIFDDVRPAMEEGHNVPDARVRRRERVRHRQGIPADGFQGGIPDVLLDDAREGRIHDHDRQRRRLHGSFHHNAVGNNGNDSDGGNSDGDSSSSDDDPPPPPPPPSGSDDDENASTHSDDSFHSANSDDSFYTDDGFLEDMADYQRIAQTIIANNWGITNTENDAIKRFVENVNRPESDEEYEDVQSQDSDLPDLEEIPTGPVQTTVGRAGNLAISMFRRLTSGMYQARGVPYEQTGDQRDTPLNLLHNPTAEIDPLSNPSSDLDLRTDGSHIPREGMGAGMSGGINPVNPHFEEVTDGDRIIRTDWSNAYHPIYNPLFQKDKGSVPNSSPSDLDSPSIAYVPSPEVTVHLSSRDRNLQGRGQPNIPMDVSRNER